MSEQQRGRTELDDLNRPVPPPEVWFTFVRDARLFTADRVRLRELERGREIVSLVPAQLFHPPAAIDAVVRRGKLRVSEFLPDGQEVTRAVLQNGAVFRTRPVGFTASGEDAGGAGAASRSNLADTVLTALGETELWILPPGSLRPPNRRRT
jgi:hypothetical protein